jgi:hypothetical protein
MNFLSPLIDWHFWFDLTPTRMTATFEALFFGLFALCIFAGAVLRMYVRNAKFDKYKATIVRRVAAIATWSGVIGLVWFFFTFEEIQFFGSRFWFLVWIAGVIVAVVQLVRYTKNEVPELQHREQSRAEVNKYLPRRAR